MFHHLKLEEVQNQRNLSLAENGDLVPKIEAVELEQTLQRMAQLYRRHPIAAGKHIRVSPPGKHSVRADAQLIRRILGNMLKNALEASSVDQTVTLSCDCSGGYASIHVHNAAAIEPNDQLRIFSRSFSTKGGFGRGLGTYSMKLLGEKYLHGRVSFDSTPETGTTFTIPLPRCAG